MGAIQPRKGWSLIATSPFVFLLFLFIGIFHRSFFCHADFADDADFFIHRITRNLFGDFLLRRLLTDLRSGDRFGRCRYP